ncbi:hypothetical protein DR66_3814 [Delftia acidovorans]|uniref:DUF2938 domain-containing protein n=1 Tax=Delftia acidovorans TaxID=80866 RepID=UPI0005011842|nr:DUF2938 domain-containing protein [Delftia acidovorans]KFJ12968.1 hypothetical protein DR66_3814 [Delftia acidovorans]QQB53171.1 DUF2938 domain-containing protein [Delftia acidovorans]
MLTMAEAAKVVFVGAGATAVMDVWGMAQRTLGMPTLDFAMVGRWAGHLVRGRFMHNVIGKSAPIAGERALGWTIHYLVGIAFAALLIALYGLDWLQAPRLMPALIVGVATVAFPFFVMQPAMGVGVAASRTPTPWANRLRSVLGHAVFGLGMYASALLVNAVWR